MQAVIKTLVDAGIESARLDAQLLLAHVTGKTREEILLESPTLTPTQQNAFDALIARRANREPLSHLIGKREFYGREFIVTKDTLDPRPDSETLIEAALSLLTSPACGGGQRSLRPKDVSAVSGGTLPSPSFVTQATPANKTCPLPHAGEVKILDVGTGTGCLLLTLLAELPQTQGIGVDISEKALTVAAQNAEKLGVAERTEFYVGDMASLRGAIGDEAIQKMQQSTGLLRHSVPRNDVLFDLIISNPPYIATAEIATLMPEVAQFEPKLALDGGKDGLDCYRKLAKQTLGLLAPRGALVLEIGSTQADAVSALMREGGLHVEAVAKDLAGNPRCIIAHNP